jgi:uncharacterized protein (DUF885 family)
MNQSIFAALTAVTLAGCAAAPRAVDFDTLTAEFVFGSLAMSPVTATGAGYHRHGAVALDELLDDYGQAALQRQRVWNRAFRQRLDAIAAGALSPEQEADRRIMRGQLELNLLELDLIRRYRHSPALYVELIGTALFDCHVRQYAPLAERYRHIVARLEKVPVLLGQARENLAGAPELWTRVARQELAGTIDLVDRTLRAAAPPDLRPAYDAAAAKALAAMRSFDGFLAADLAARPVDWRLGKEMYGRKFRHAVATDGGPEAVLADAERELESVRRRMYEIARPLHERLVPGARDRGDLNTVVRETLDRIAQRHATPASYFSDARRDLDEAARFVSGRGLVPLPGRDNLAVIETPEFMRGIYSVGGFNPAPPLEPQLGAYYWLTPIPPDWPAERAESKLREYNYYGLKLLTIHEAMPGHYVQFEYANDIQPRPRRLLRAIFANGPYVEGWAVYATEMMLDEGYLDHSPELRLTFLKQQLRVVANAILDIRLHTMGMSDEEAMSLMVDQAFQEKEEASGKLIRAKLSSCQLPTYFVGWRDWHRLRNLYRSSKGQAFPLPEFHRRALEAGAVPLPALAQLLTGRALE